MKRRQSRVDLLLATAVGAPAVAVTAAFVDKWAGNDRTVDAWALVLVAVAFGVLAVRRRRPLVTLGITTAAVSVYLIAAYPYGPVLIAFFIVVYTVASILPLRTASISVAVALFVLLTHLFVHPNALGGLLGLVPGSAWAVVPFAIGVSVRASRQTRDAAREQAVRQQLYEERIRLAQEVHDIVGHGLAAIQMQADVALHVDEQQSPNTRTALESISRASSEAFEELRSALDLIGQPDGATRSPTAGIGNIEELCDRIRAAGVSVDLVEKGDMARVPSPVGLAAYRLVQESLTNVIRHGAVPEAAVHVEAGHGSIDLWVTNPGPVSGETPSGHGIAGMRRRVGALAGTFDARATPDGFVVEASIPFGDAR